MLNAERCRWQNQDGQPVALHARRLAGRYEGFFGSIRIFLMEFQIGRAIHGAGQHRRRTGLLRDHHRVTISISNEKGESTCQHSLSASSDQLTPSTTQSANKWPG